MFLLEAGQGSKAGVKDVEGQSVNKTLRDDPSKGEGPLGVLSHLCSHSGIPASSLTQQKRITEVPRDSRRPGPTQ